LNLAISYKLGGYCNIKVKPWFSRIKGSRSLIDVSSMFSMDLAISSSEKGMLPRGMKHWVYPSKYHLGDMKTRACKLSWNRPGIIIQKNWKAGDAIWFLTHCSSHAWYELWKVTELNEGHQIFKPKQSIRLKGLRPIVLPQLKLHSFHLHRPNTYQLSSLAAANWDPEQIAKSVRNTVPTQNDPRFLAKRTLTGQISLRISSHVLIGFREITWWMKGVGRIFERR